MNETFLLETPTAVRIYERVKDLPVVDYHCHLNAAEIYNDKHFSGITEVWLGGDHYKWRAMRNMGIDVSDVWVREKVRDSILKFKRYFIHGAI